MRASYFYSLTLILILISCQPKQTETQVPGGTLLENNADNLLTPQEVQEGWQLLFDGNSFNGWHSYGKDSIQGWMIEDGQLTNDPEVSGGDLTTNNQYSNFELSLDWKIAKGGNSGIIYRIVENATYESPHETGPEYQLIDNSGYPQELQPGQLTAANYDMHPPAKDAFTGADIYQRTRILVQDSLVEHWLNDELIVSYIQWSEDWQNRLALSKWVDYPGYGTARTGLVGLQDHGDRIWFKNIKLKPLP